MAFYKNTLWDFNASISAGGRPYFSPASSSSVSASVLAVDLVNNEPEN